MTFIAICPGKRKQSRSKNNIVVNISIHTSARRATFLSLEKLRRRRISIHAPARGATISKFLTIRTLEFQSTLLRGERLEKAKKTGLCTYFNPRSREESDLMPTPIREPARIFQSTLPRGERRMLSVSPQRFFIFQSTLPRGERLTRRRAMIRIL